MNTNVKTLTPIDPATFDFEAQHRRCVEWKDADQWIALAVLYYQRGYFLNALHCFEKAAACRSGVPAVRVAVETEP